MSGPATTRADPRGAQTAKGQRRRELILKVASELFAEFGYGRVTLNEIGAAAEITGPGIYRYFSGKEDILAAIYEHLYGRHRAGYAAVMAGGGSDRDLLVGLVDLQMQLATEEPEKIRIITSEERHLPARMAAALAIERHGALTTWAGLIARARPELSPEEIKLTIHGVLALVNSISLRRGPEPLQARTLDRLRLVAIGVVLGEPGEVSPLAPAGMSG